MMTTLLPAADLALVPGEIVLDDTVAPRGPWSAVVAAGDVMTIVDLHGNRRSTRSSTRRAITPAAIRRPLRSSGSTTCSLTTGSVLRSDDASPLMTIVADEVATTTRSAVPAHRSRTRCATATTPSTSTRASRTSSSRAPAGVSVSATWSRTSTSS